MAVIRAGAIVAEAAGRLKSAPLYTMIPVGRVRSAQPSNPSNLFFAGSG